MQYIYSLELNSSKNGPTHRMQHIKNFHENPYSLPEKTFQTRYA